VKTLANRLALIFLLITLGVIAIVYLGVVPNLRSSLVDERGESLRSAAARDVPAIARAITGGVTQRELDQVVRNAADQANARVTLLSVGAEGLGTRPLVRSDSNARADIGDLDFPAAAEAVQARRTASGTESASGGRVVQAARPLFFRDPKSGNRTLAFVVVYSAPLGDVERSVSLVRSRIIIAAVIALALAVLAAYAVANSLGRRVARLQHVAERVAVGDFSARFPVEGQDELGRLAQALDQMQRQLAALDSSRRRFIATASHELRTPVFSLGGFLELLEDEDLDEETRARFLDQVREQTTRLRKLTTDLLDLSRLDAGSVELRLADTDVDELAQTVTGEFLPALEEHESSLSVTPAGEPVSAVCDPDRVAQIMRILIDNALTHTPPGTAVAVSTTRGDGDVTIAVTDSGLGIPRADLPRVFEPFYTSDGARGSGLGLTIARDLAERMGGALSVNSRPGHTTFSLRIPASPRHEA
jgi:signal transduction histidine kinase